MKKLTAFEATEIFSLHQGDAIDPKRIKRLVDRGFVRVVSDTQVALTDEGRAAFKRYMGAELPAKPAKPW
jgi:hypothetical protein